MIAVEAIDRLPDFGKADVLGLAVEDARACRLRALAAARGE
jgi:hypothetical protein